MPKRPCAIAFTPDSQTVLCGDKFGDVYALPVIESGDSEPPRKKTRVKSSGPAATSLTVHTKGNLQALEYQKRLAQKATNDVSTLDQAPSTTAFPYDPVIGHVSMLTDLTTASVSLMPTTNEPQSSITRSFILTSDRDEHIRVSRGLPQSHVIHSFCLGHQQFVNQLCILKSGLLVSGGGDDYLCVWDWQQGQLLAKVSISDLLVQAAEDRKLAVCCIRDCSGASGASSFVCACEGVPKLLHVELDRSTTSARHEKTVVELHGNPLDFSFQPSSKADSSRLLVCLDSVHQPGSTTSTREEESFGPRLQSFAIEESNGKTRLVGSDGTYEARVDSQCTPQAIVTSAQVVTAQLSGLPYGAENLRKRGAEETE